MYNTRLKEFIRIFFYFFLIQKFAGAAQTISVSFFIDIALVTSRTVTSLTSRQARRGGGPLLL